VQTQSGYEVVLVKPYVAPSFAQVQTQVLAQLQQQTQQAAQAELSKVLEKRVRALHVKVDPRYGKWVFDKDGARVVPPKTPDVRESRNSTSTAPTTLPITPPANGG
jgi:hypothetical protein